METLIKSGDKYELSKAVIDEIKNTESQLSILKERYDAMKKAIYTAMENNNILKLENDDIRINYIAPAKQERFDSKRLKEDNPDLYDLYVKLIDVSGSVRIKVKENDNQ